MMFSDKLIRKSDRCMTVGRVATLLLFLISVTTLFSFMVIFPTPLKGFSNDHVEVKPLRNRMYEDMVLMKCDLFSGKWIPDEKGSRYTNTSCLTIPDAKNCFKHGRTDEDFLKWRWKPESCDLPRFDSKVFLEMFRGSKMAFVGDSVAKNQMDSLLCLLSSEEMPKEVYRDSEDRNVIWNFPNHDFTLMILWTKFLVSAQERIVNGTSSGTFDLNLDQIDTSWVPNVPTVDYMIISTAHWFFRPIYLHKGDKAVGCVYCSEQNVIKLSPGTAISMSLKAALSYITECKECRGMVTVIRTFSPAHFENGSWNTGGGCNRTRPFGEDEVNLNGGEFEIRDKQVDEVEIAKKKVVDGDDEHKKKFGIVDVTKAMLMRPDGHPGEHWGNQWMKGYNDCVHWCLPGPIDVWNDLLMVVLARLSAPESPPRDDKSLQV